MSLRQAIADRWLTPAGLLIVLGLVIWLIQLNQNAIENAEAIGALRAQNSIVAKEMVKLGLVVQRGVALQESLFGQVERLDERFEKHELLMYQNGNLTK